MMLRRWKLCGAVMLGMLCAANAAAQQPLLSVWINGDKGYKGLQKVGDKFTAETGVKVVVEHPESAPDKFQAAAGAGRGPDVFCWPHDRAGEWAKSGLLIPIQPSKRINSQIEEGAWKAFTYRNQIWGYPLSIEAVGLIYNKKLVATPPKTWAEVIELDKKLRPEGKSAIMWDYNKSFFSWALFAGEGGYVFKQDAQGNYNIKDVGVNTPGAVKSIETLAKLIQDGHMPKGARYDEMEGAFSRNKVAMMISGPWAWDNVKKVGIDFGVAPIPGVTGPGRPFVGVLGCMISAASKQRDIAKEFLEQHVLKLEGLKTINADVPLGTPANKALFAELSSNAAIAATMENARLGAPIPNIPEVGRFWPAVDAALEAVTNGRQSPKDALDAAAARMLAR
jgi:maltose/maltodextrin transport system substrate-binding protein